MGQSQPFDSGVLFRGEDPEELCKKYGIERNQHETWQQALDRHKTRGGDEVVSGCSWKGSGN